MINLLARTMYASRLLLALFCLGLVAGLALYLVRFMNKIAKLALDLFHYSDEDVLIALLHLVDSALVASLVVIVALVTFDSMVSRLQEAEDDPRALRWVSQTDLGNLKTKVATAIVAISSIHLLQIFMKLESYSPERVMWSVIIHLVFVVGAVLLALVDGMGKKAKE